MIPGGIHDSVGAQGGPRFGPRAHEGLELSFEADFLGPMTVGIQPFNAEHQRGLS